MSAAPKITVTADKTLQKRKAFKELQSMHVVVGVPEKTATLGRSGDDTNAEIAYLQENGSPARNIPPRPFLRVSLDAKKADLAGVLRAAAVDFCDGKLSAENAYTKAGLFAQSVVKAYIKNSNNFTPLKASTLARRKAKGFLGEKPLIETGQLLNSIDFDVRRRG